MTQTRYCNVILTSLLLASLIPATFGQEPQTTAPRSPWRDPQVSQQYKNWLKEDVVFLATDQERREFRSLTSDQQRDEFIAAFWERRNPTPGSARNAFKEEHYRRVAYANQHFAPGVPPEDSTVASTIPGWMTDRGRIYIVYGTPQSIDSHPIPSPPREIWHFVSLEGVTNVALTFTDKTGRGDYVLNDSDVDWLRQMRDGQAPHQPPH